MDVDRQALKAGINQLREHSGLPAKTIASLESFIETADDYALFRINPIQYAHDQGLSEAEAVSLFLYAARYGLVEMNWNVLCYACAHVAQSLDHMKDMHPQFTCPFCGAENDVGLDDYIQVTFTVLPQVRRIAYHDPFSLPIEDYYYRYHFAKGALPYGGKFPFYEGLAGLSVYMGYVEPGASREVQLELSPGALHLKDLSHKATLVISLGEAASEEQVVPLELVDHAFKVKTMPTGPVEFDLPTGPFRYQQAAEAASGTYAVKFTNQMATLSPLWILYYPPDFEVSRVEFEPFLSGKQLVTHSLFRELFRGQTMAEDENIKVGDITLLFTDLTASTALYDRIGDAQAYALVRQHFESLMEAVTHFEGAIVKTIGDAIMASFADPLNGVRAALRILRNINALNDTISESLSVKIGVHRGHSIAVTLNGRLDFFGQTANVASRIQGLAEPNTIVLSDALYRSPGVADLVKGYAYEPKAVSLKGVAGSAQVHVISDPGRQAADYARLSYSFR